MLTQLTIHQFAIVQFLELDFLKGMTTITGETGAGKSIAIDALGLCLGTRADANMIRVGADKAEVNARFSLQNNHNATLWLKNNELTDTEKSDDKNNECLLRRVISKEGRSRSYINGTPVPLSQLKSLGQLLVNIHSQDAHQTLLKTEIQLAILDEYAAHNHLLQKVKEAYQCWHFLNKQLKQHLLNQNGKEARKQLLEYQIKELDEFALEDGEFQQIEQEHKRLANSDALQDGCQRALSQLIEGEDFDSLTLLRKSILEIEAQMQDDKNLQNIVKSLQEAVIQIEEASYELREFSENLDLSPERFQQVEERMTNALSLARKHQVQPEMLYDEHQKLIEEYNQLNNNETMLQQLNEDLEKAKCEYQKQAKCLSQSRIHYSKALNKKITASIQQLNMEEGQFEVVITQHEKKHLSSLGYDEISFQVTTNAGQPLQALSKVASGGELSRISLAIQVIISQRVATPTLVFDEVDVGISGATAAIVGKLLRTLAENTQIFCVTHLPQVAGNGHQQLLVNKQSNGKTTNTTMQTLSDDERINELARLLSGDTITDRTLANAQELLVKQRN
jgi:DNA repair protein RecN (Recombination protein N)